MKRVMEDQSVNEVKGPFTRSARGLGSFMVQGKLKWKEKGGGTGTVTWRDAFTGETIASESVTANGGASTSLTDIPYNYTVELSAATGGCVVDVVIDGDAP